MASDIMGDPSPPRNDAQELYDQYAEAYGRGG